MFAETSRKRNFETLQLLRGIAATLVVFYHGMNTKFLQIFKLGYMGVDVFFVLSGFIICYIHFSDFGQKNKLIPYIQKRIIRIYPIYLIMTLLYVLTVSVFGHKITIDYLVKSMLLIPQEKDPIIGVAWTLQHELLFYFLFGLAIWNKKVFSGLVFLWGTAILIFTLFKGFSFPVNSLTKLIFSSINLEFLFGCSIALTIIKKKFRLNFITSFGLFALVISVLLNLSGLINLDRIISWGIPSAIIILGLVKLENEKIFKIPKVLITLGDASYSIYLTHLLTLLVLESIIRRIKTLTLINKSLSEIIICIVAIIGGCVFYYFVERPLLKFLKNKFLGASKRNNANEYNNNSLLSSTINQGAE